MQRLAALLVIWLAACAPTRPANPALWEMRGPHGQHGWLLGTMHALPPHLGWRTGKIRAALAASDELMVEAAGIADASEPRRIFLAMGRAAAPVPPELRIDPAHRPALAALIARSGQDPAQLAGLKTWALALTLGQVAQRGGDDLDAANGADRALLADHGAARVVELEGVTAQFQQFKRLPEATQRRLLGAVLAGQANAGAELAMLARAWARGDVAAMERTTREGLLADPELRAALFTTRNQAWAGPISASLKAGHHPFVAVGAAHMLGPDGLVALLSARGYRVTRVE
ncbi:MAG: TraB/GumN family protein [Proteobacteria bacterium]|nr:TraB/GumN family protein [Pseudomonadota bacterium]